MHRQGRHREPLGLGDEAWEDQGMVRMVVVGFEQRAAITNKIWTHGSDSKCPFPGSETTCKYQ